MKIKNLRKSFGTKTLYEDLNFEVNDGNIFALIGPNGVGKTTLMKIILGWDKDFCGQVIVDEHKVFSYSPETPEFPDFLTGREMMDFFIKIRKSSDDANVLLSKVGLNCNDKTKIKDYSKGMKQRLAVAQALIGSPNILLLDEPTAGLDYFGQMQMQELFKELREEGRTIILNSHLLLDVEQICDNGVIIMGPKLYKNFSKEDFKNISLGDMFMQLARQKQEMETKIC